jgi:hypothetical protein
MFFINETGALERVIGEINTFRSANPTLAVSHNEALKIMKGRITTMNNVRELLLSTGDFFYELASKVLLYYEEHRKWIFNGSPWKEKAMVRRPVGLISWKKPLPAKGKGNPMPFYDCIIIGFDRPMPLSERLLGKKVLETPQGRGFWAIWPPMPSRPPVSVRIPGLLLIWSGEIHFARGKRIWVDED